MMNVLITEDCFVEGKPKRAGEILENVEKKLAALLLSSGRAKLAPAKEAPKKQAKKSAKKVAKVKSQTDEQ